jgi:transcriptional regulator with XRE-family HTH domain
MNGDNIRIERVIKKMSQQELAKKVKVTRSYISLIEAGKQEPSIAVLSRIADALGCSIKKFF